MYADNDGVRIAWEVHGPLEPVEEPPTLVLVHGLGYARAGWGVLPDLLARHVRVVMLDNRGIGASDVPPGPYAAAEMAGDVVAVLDAAGLRRAHVLGASLGGMVAQEIALAHPDRVQRLVLLSTTPGGEDAHPMPQRTVDLLTRMPGMEPLEALRAAVANALAPGHVERDPELVDRIVDVRLADPQDPAGWQAQAHAGTTYDGGDRLEVVAAPTLVLHGDADVVVDPANGELLAKRIPDARLEVLAGHGHLPFWEDPAAVAGRVLAFLGVPTAVDR